MDDGSQMELLSSDVVAFLMDAMLSGRLTRPAACALIAPWVEGDGRSTVDAEWGAQLISGFDIALNAQGHQVHASKVGNIGPYLVSPEDMNDRCLSWLKTVRSI